MKYNTITKQVAETVPGGVYEGIDYHGTVPADVAARAGWVDVTPEIQAQLDAEAVAADSAKQSADFAANAERYSYGNAFLLLCDTVTGGKDHAKLSFEVLPSVLLSIKSASREQYEDLRDAFDLINSACFKKFGLDWWDSVTWIEHPAIIDAAQKILAAIGAVK
jgi:hypothetical protein